MNTQFVLLKSAHITQKCFYLVQKLVFLNYSLTRIKNIRSNILTN